MNGTATKAKLKGANKAQTKVVIQHKWKFKQKRQEASL